MFNLLAHLTEDTYKINVTEWKEKYNIGKPDARSIIGGTLLEWYEHPIYGDEAGFIVVTPDGKVHPTGEYEILNYQDEM